MRGVWIKLDAVRIVEAADMSCVLDDRNLHAEAQTKVRNLMLTCVFCGKDHSLDTAGTESARYENTGYIG